LSHDGNIQTATKYVSQHSGGNDGILWPAVKPLSQQLSALQQQQNFKKIT